mgnify:CR=1 FL=1
MNSEASFLFSTFNEFYKCWRSGANSRLFIESVNGKAFINFSAFIGYPDNAHFKPWQHERNPSKGPRKKSANKIKRDNDRAARFQARKRKEEEEAASVSKSAADLEAIAASSPNPSSESVMTVSDIEFSFASPVPEVLRHSISQDKSMILSNSKEQKVQRVQKGPTSCNILDQEGDSTFNSSISKFQGEEDYSDEMQEYVYCEEDSNFGILIGSGNFLSVAGHPDYPSMKYPPSEVINNLSEDLFTAFENEGPVDNRLDIKASLVDRSLIIKSDISATHSGAEDLGATIMRANVLWPRPNHLRKAIFLSSESKMTLMSTIDNFKEQIVKLTSIQEKDDFEMTIEK